LNIENYIGFPWENGAQGPYAFDCWGLVRYIYKKEKGIEIPFFDIDAMKPLAIRKAFQESSEYRNWAIVQDAEDFDVVLLSMASRPHHVGIWHSGRLLHCVEGAGVVWQESRSLKMHGWNITAIYRRI